MTRMQVFFLLRKLLACDESLEYVLAHETGRGKDLWEDAAEHWKWRLAEELGWVMKYLPAYSTLEHMAKLQYKIPSEAECWGWFHQNNFQRMLREVEKKHAQEASY